MEGSKRFLIEVIYSSIFQTFGFDFGLEDNENADQSGLANESLQLDQSLLNKNVLINI